MPLLDLILSSPVPSPLVPPPSWQATISLTFFSKLFLVVVSAASWHLRDAWASWKVNAWAHWCRFAVECCETTTTMCD